MGGSSENSSKASLTGRFSFPDSLLILTRPPVCRRRRARFLSREMLHVYQATHRGLEGVTTDGLVLFTRPHLEADVRPRLRG